MYPFLQCLAFRSFATTRSSLLPLETKTFTSRLRNTDLPFSNWPFLSLLLRIVASCLPCLLSLHSLQADEWPQFRGPRGDGHALQQNLPIRWSETNGVAWKTPIHGRAWSSPVVSGNQIWITTATEDGKELFALEIDIRTGKIRHDLKLFTVEKPQFAHKFNTYASPTPVIETGRVYVTFGSPGTACLDAETGKILWQRRDLECNHYRGAGSSPILFEDLLLMNFDGSDHQFIVALDKRTGETVWRKDRSIDFKDLGPDGKPESEGDWRKAFSTPHLATIDGQPLLISQGAKAVYAYNPRTGVERWRVEERTSHSASARPISGDGLVYINSGWSSGQILAIRPGAPGEVLDANSDSSTNPGQLQVVWRSKRNVPKKPSMLWADGLLYSIDDGGVAACLDGSTGKEVWRERVGGNFSAAPILADGRLYFCNEEGVTTVIRAGREFVRLAENKLDDGFMASPAVMGHFLILRTRTALYRIDP